MTAVFTVSLLSLTYLLVESMHKTFRNIEKLLHLIYTAQRGYSKQKKT